MAGCHQTRLCLSWADDGFQTRLSWVYYGQRVRRRASCGGCACFKNASSRSVRKRCISRHMARGHARLPHAMRCNIPRTATPGSAHRTYTSCCVRQCAPGSTKRAAAAGSYGLFGDLTNALDASLATGCGTLSQHLRRKHQGGARPRLVPFVRKELIEGGYGSRIRGVPSARE